MSKTFKKINKNGSVTIPRNIRAAVGLFSGNGVEINVNSDGSLTIKPSALCCRFCGSLREILTVENIVICVDCAKKILAKVDVVND